MNFKWLKRVDYLAPQSDILKKSTDLAQVMKQIFQINKDISLVHSLSKIKNKEVSIESNYQPNWEKWVSTQFPVDKGFFWLFSLISQPIWHTDMLQLGIASSIHELQKNDNTTDSNNTHGNSKT